MKQTEIVTPAGQRVLVRYGIQQVGDAYAQFSIIGFLAGKDGRYEDVWFGPEIGAVFPEFAPLVALDLRNAETGLPINPVKNGGWHLFNTNNGGERERAEARKELARFLMSEADAEKMAEEFRRTVGNTKRAPREWAEFMVARYFAQNAQRFADLAAEGRKLVDDL